MGDPQRSPALGHSRSRSVAKPRSSMTGPLEAADDPLASTLSPSQPGPATQRAHQSMLSPRSPQPSRGRSAPGSPVPQLGEPKAKDFSFLLRPEIYHPITSLNIPAAFRNSPKQPGPEIPLEELLAKGHFRAAAVAAVQELTGLGATGGIDPHDSQRIFRLLYTRLACLTLIDATSLAAQEVKALEDLNNVRVYVDETTGEHLVPWELRVLNVRLQALGFGDTRRAVMSYHDLAREARARIVKSTAVHDNSATELWKSRLADLGIKVAGALIEMGDLPGAASHLDSLRDRGDSKLIFSKALLLLHLGDTERARACAQKCTEDQALTNKIILALCDMADTEFEAALEKWQDLRLEHDDEMIGVNAAVCLLYLGRLQESRDVLEGLIGKGLSSHTLLFNLSTVYELCTEKHRNMKTKLAERVAAFDETPSGWEKTTADFKL
ncbi:unnamed protein product [Clonostachys rosea f. rosea IK726]|uniref:Trafficking protein particle complex subunit 12 n=2 Tax=Bionectria ochroleuca TaxID=29856 RepID=A0A0B7K1W2_BIOOC|nr:unnamed protein product [Clonostachys rosea f. rosea IK726]